VHGAQRRPETGAPAVPAARVHQGALTARLTEILMHIRRPPGSLRQPPNALRPDKTDREDGAFGVGLGAGVVPSSAVTGTAGQCGYVTGCTMRSASTLANRCCTQRKTLYYSRYSENMDFRYRACDANGPTLRRCLPSLLLRCHRRAARSGGSDPEGVAVPSFRPGGWSRSGLHRAAQPGSPVAGSSREVPTAGCGEGRQWYWSATRPVPAARAPYLRGMCWPPVRMQ
jgi:hypothetical protein